MPISPHGCGMRAGSRWRILAAMKKIWGERMTTVFPRQGHYALDPHNIDSYPAADLTVERIGELTDHDMGALAWRSAGR